MSEYEHRHYLNDEGLHIEASLGERSFTLKAAPSPMWAEHEIGAVVHIEIDGDDIANAYLTRVQAMALAAYLLDRAQ